MLNESEGRFANEKRILSIFVVITMVASVFTFMPVNKVSAADNAAAYVMAYYTKESSGTSMTYMDDSLHLAYSYDKVHWTALNDNNGILFAKNPGYRANPANGLQLRDPFLFRKQDGKFVLLATVTTSAGATTSSSIFAWDTDDLINYKNERTILMNSSNTPAKAPECKYDAANGNYVIY